MRQLHSFLEQIRVRNIKKEYYRMSFQAKLKGAEMLSLEEVLGVPLDEEHSSSFDEKSNREMEARALQLLEERRKLKNV